MNLARKKSVRLYQNVAEQIRTMILDGTLIPGDQLLPERQLAEKLGVSRSAVREALAFLSSQGFIKILPGSGTYIKKVKIDDVIAPFTNVVLQEIDNVYDLLEARLILETGVVKLAVKRANQTDLRVLEKLVKDMAIDIKTGHNNDESDSQFHFALVRATHNPVIINLMTVLMGLMKEYYGPSRKQLVEKQMDLWSKQHSHIYEAVRDGDENAAVVAITEHLNLTIDEFKKIKGLV